MQIIFALIGVLMCILPIGAIFREPADFFYQLSKIGALSGTVVFCLSLVMGVRFKWLERWAGRDRIVFWHHVLGNVAFLSVLWHGAYSLFSLGLGLLQSIGMFFGFAALICFLLMMISIWLYKMNFLMFEGWRILHGINYLIFPIAYIHSLLASGIILSTPILRWEWMFLGLIAVVSFIYRVNRWLMIRKYPYKVTAVVKETHDIWSLKIQGKPIKFIPGQYLYLQYIKNGKVSSAHPFTIASSPTQPILLLSIKAVGDFTNEVVTLDQSNKVLIDGPYGRFSFLNAHELNQGLVFIAGGIGITPFLSMLRYIRDQRIDRRIWLIWGNKTEEDIGFTEELDAMQNQIHSLSIVHVLSHENKPGFETGFIDIDRISKIVGEIGDQSFFICGPQVMMENVIKGLRKMEVPLKKIHWEAFTI